MARFPACVGIVVFALMACASATVNAADTLNTELATAVQKGDLAGMERLLKQGERPELRDAQGYDALDYAIEWGQAGVAAALLQRSLEARMQTPAQRAFSSAILAGQHAKPPADATALFVPLLRLAAHQGHLAAVQQLLALGVAVDAGAADGYSALALAVRWRHHALVEVLLSKGANVNLPTQTCYQTVPLMEATRHGDVAMMRRLIAAGAQINAPDKYGDHALNWAIFFGQTEQVKLLVAHGADLKRTGQTDDQPIEIAIRQGHDAIVAFLQSSGAVARPGKDKKQTK